MRYAPVLGLAALALLARPLPARSPMPTPPPRLVIEVDEQAKVARLVIPSKFVTGRPESVPAAPPARSGRLPTVMAGAALALALAFGGLWLVRRRGAGPGIGVVLVVVAVLGVAATAAWANLRPLNSEPVDTGPRGDPASDRLAAIMIGLTLTLAVTFAGAWYIRRRQPGNRTLPTVLALCVLGLGGAALWADIAPRRGRPPGPPQPRPEPPPAVVLPALAALDSVRLEVVPQGDAIRLILTPTQKAKLAAAFIVEVKPTRPPASRPDPKKDR